MDDLSSIPQAGSKAMASELAGLHLVQCSRTLNGIPVEILSKILEYVVADEVHVCVDHHEDKTGTKPWVPDLMLVSDKFNVTAKKAIAKHAQLSFFDTSQFEMHFEAIENHGAQENWRGHLRLTKFPEYLVSEASRLTIIQGNMYCNHLDVGTFPKLRKVTFWLGSIETWPFRVSRLMIAVSRATTDFVATLGQKLTGLVRALADADVLSPGEVTILLSICRGRLLEWTASAADAKMSELMVFHEALRFRLEAGPDSTAALLKRICAVDFGICRSNIGGLSDHTVLIAGFTTESDGKGITTFANLSFHKDRTEVDVNRTALVAVVAELESKLNG
ncbi:uncharacterized protein AB675_7739 [Cyphellophora attinorum]|uniref:Uncharacterized protein n=1 Tax=Cyphellophora attinorum TaxID=1664694 RepID=A0A0N1H9R6_9EURO|nr:uncharacterized protein AB675_7739 [Phialophora attinorum]KPI40476.1 hypothetical protein AB675_7739 [Phialophora attinorum]